MKDKLYAQGPGVRYTIWTQGCSIHCPGCSNKDTWDPLKGSWYKPVDIATEILNTEGIDGVTITGGEPLDQFEEVYDLCERVFDKVSIFLTTGYKEIKLEHLKILNVLDMICIGPFEQDKICRDGWRGSSNQEVRFLTDRGLKQKNLPSVYKEVIISKQGEALETGFHI